MQYVYLHGFASGNNGLKATFLKARMDKLGIDLVIPDLNENDFANLTMSRQIKIVKELIKTHHAVTLFGSSMGGLLSIILAEELNNITRLILFAPALQMAKRWTAQNKDRLNEWRQTGSTMVYHYGYKKSVPLNYTFIEDLVKYENEDFSKNVPTLIFHGTRDTAVPHEVSVNYAKTRDYVSYYEVDSDHSLEDKLSYMWQIIERSISTNTETK